MPRVRALKEVRYAGVNRVPGTDSEQFDASEKDAYLLSRIKKVEYVADPEPVRKGGLSTKTQAAKGKVTTQQPQNNPVPQPSPTPPSPQPASTPEPANPPSLEKEPQPQSAVSTSDVPSTRGTYRTADLRPEGNGNR